MATPYDDSLPQAARSHSKSYSNFSISGSSRAHLGDTYITGSTINLSQSDIFALTGPLNVTTAFQGLTLITTRLVLELNTTSTPNDDDRSQLRSAISGFRDVLRKILPASILGSMTPSRAVLVPATDLVAVISSAVLLFSEIEEFVSSNLEELRSNLSRERRSTEIPIRELITRLGTLNNILHQYVEVLQCDTDAEATERANAVHRIVQGHFGQRQQRLALKPIIEDHGIGSRDIAAGIDRHGDISSQHRNSIVKPEFAHLADAVGSQEGHTEDDTLQPKSWKLEFEEELFRSAVYSRTSNNSQSVSDLHSTIGTPAMSILSQLTLADVSIVSVLHLPVKLETLVNRSAYSDGLNVEVELGHTIYPGTLADAKGLDQTQHWPDFFIRTNIPHPSHNYTQEIALALGIPMHATRDHFITAALEFADIKRKHDGYSLYITDDTRAGVKEIYMQEDHRPLLLHSELSLLGFSPSFILRQTQPKEEQAISLHQKAEVPDKRTGYFQRFLTIFRSARSRGMGI